MGDFSAAAIANPNIAFIKYWGNRDPSLRIPVNGSISMNLDGLFTSTRVTFRPELERDTLDLNGKKMVGSSVERVAQILEIVRQRANIRMFAEVISKNNFPTGAGIASSAAAFAALALAASKAAGLELSEAELSRLARRGSGSAARSVPGGFVEWQPGENDLDSYAFSIASPQHWDLIDLVVIVKKDHKHVSSYEGHTLAERSPLQNARVADASRRLVCCRNAIQNRDFDALAHIVELDSNLMHAVMITSSPPLFYWEPLSLTLMKLVPRWRKNGIAVCYTLDAGPNVHLICLSESEQQVRMNLEQIANLKGILRATVGGPARLID